MFPGLQQNRMDGESNENVYIKFGMSSRGEGMSCGVVEMVKNGMVWAFGKDGRGRTDKENIQK